MRVNKLHLRIASIVVLVNSAFTAVPAMAQQSHGNYAGDLIVSFASYTDPGFAVGAALPNSAGVTAIASSAFRF